MPLDIVLAVFPRYLLKVRESVRCADFGFDPLFLGVDKDALTWYREAELQNGRWAMAAVAGILGKYACFIPKPRVR